MTIATLQADEQLSKSLGLTGQTAQNETLFTAKGRKADKARQALSAWALKQFATAKDDRWKQQMQWQSNLAFYFGEHYIQFKVHPASRSASIYVPPAPYWRVRPVINQVRKIARKEMARLTAQQPNAYVIPASLEDRDVFAAQAGERIWSALWRDHKLNSVLRKAVFWQTICGNGFIKQYWDLDKVDRLNNVVGDIQIVPVTPFHIFVPDLKEEEIENQPFVIHAQIRDKQQLEFKYGKNIADTTKLQEIDQQMYSAMGINHVAKRSTMIVLEFWVKPGVYPDLPDGGVFTILENEIVNGVEGWLYSHEEYPFSKLDAIPTGKFYNDSIIQDLTWLQRELNRTRGQIIEFKNILVKPRFLAEEGSVEPGRITSEPGQFILHKPGYNAPRVVEVPPLPGFVSEDVSRIYADMADLSGQHEVSHGQVPPGITAAVAISYLQEQDESLISSHFDSLEEAIEKTARQCLTYVKDYWNERRTVKLTGIDTAFDVKAFKGSDLRGNTDIRVESGSALPTSRAAKQAFILDLMKMNFIPPEKGLEILEIGGLNKLYEQIQVDVRQAQRENLKMAIATPEDIARHIEIWEATAPDDMKIDPVTKLKKDPPLLIPVNDYDNHALHIEEHNRYRKSQAFETAEEHTKRLFAEHVRQHQEALIGQAGANVNLPPDMQNPLKGQGSPEFQEVEEQSMEEGEI
jgi:hypothetical protein